jgi:hypothetical protein
VTGLETILIVGILLLTAVFREKLKTLFQTLLKSFQLSHNAGWVSEIEPEPAAEIPPANFGNIRPVLGEDADPTEFGPEIHEFPEMGEPATRFEDFNRRLFVKLAAAPHDKWPTTTSDDFPTPLNFANEAEAIEAIGRHLRPRYPVILDLHGHWAWASKQLEQDPDFKDDIVDT